MARDDQIAGYDEQEIEREVQLMFPAPSCQCEVGIDPSDVCVWHITKGVEQYVLNGGE